MPNVKELETKVVMLGSQGVGKTSVVLRYCGSKFDKHVSPTIGASFFSCKVTVGRVRVKLHIWDTAGQERFRSMAPMYYKRSNAAVLVYDITSYASFLDIKSWIDELNTYADNPLVLCVLGNKSDLDLLREVDEAEAREYANNMGAIFHETSALSSEGVADAFAEIAYRLTQFADSLLRLDSTVTPPDITKLNDVIHEVIGHDEMNSTPEVEPDRSKCC